MTKQSEGELTSRTPRRSEATGTAIVTGAAQGIGLAVSLKLISEGRSVSLWDKDSERLEKVTQQLRETAKEFDAHVHSATVDVSNPDSVNVAYSTTSDAVGTPYALINNAGILGWRGPVKDLPLNRWAQIITVNLTGALICSQAVLPEMLTAGYGRIVNMASIAGKDGNAGNAGYASTKAGLIGLTKSMGKELGKQGVLVNCVTPAAADTSIFDHQSAAERDRQREKLLSLVPMGRYVEVDEIAEMVAWLVSEKCSFSTGAVFDISGGRAVY